MRKYTIFCTPIGRFDPTCPVQATMAQVQTIHDPNAQVTITPEQIQAWGQASQQSGSRSIICLDFEGLGDDDNINGFYNGGTSSLGYTGTNYGVAFTSNALGLIDSDAGGSGNFANEPSPSTTLYFLTGTSTVMNVAAGFEDGFSLYYTTQYGGAFFTVYSGLDGTGSVLGSATLPINWQNGGCTGDPNGLFCHWDPVGVSFLGVAHSVTFAGVANQVGFDDVTFGSEEPGPPEPEETPLSNWALYIGIGLIVIFTLVRLRRLI